MGLGLKPYLADSSCPQADLKLCFSLFANWGF